MSTQLSSREKLLAAVVGGVVLIFLNIFLVDYFLKNQTRLRTELATRTQAIAAMKRQLAERPVWDEREAWLLAKEPKVGNEGTAGGQLLDTVTQVAKEHSVTIEKQGIGVPSTKAEYLSISVDVETKSTWKGLIEFMHALQGPEQFIVLETADLQIDSADQTQMRGKFRVARWSAPKTGL